MPIGVETRYNIPVIEVLGSFIVNIISSTGYAGIFFLMALESALIPIPSEVTMPFSGSLVATGKLSLWVVVLTGAIGNLFGSLLAYALGFWGQETIVRSLIKKYGKYLLISEHEFERSQKWFVKYGQLIVFASRLMPVVRTFISLPAGIARMNLTRFIIYTTIGSLIWSFILAYVGVVLGQNWSSLETYFRRFDLVIVVLGVLAVIAYIYYKVKKIKS